jgi:hypothetical protein
MRISVLTDETSWLNDYNVRLLRMLREEGYDARVIHFKEDLSAGGGGDIAFLLDVFN